MLNRTMVLTDKSRYLRELPEDTLFFYDIKKPQEIAEKVELILDDPYRYADMIEKAYEYARENFSWEKTVDKLLKIIEQEKERRESDG